MSIYSDFYSNNSIPAKLTKPGGQQQDQVFVFVGIIDILQSYRFKKKLEHSFKALVHDGVRTLHTYIKIYIDRESSL